MDFLELLWDSLASITSGLQEFVDMLSNGIEQLNGGTSVDDAVIYRYIGLFRFVVGDGVFFFIWASINAGILMSLFKLILLLKDQLVGNGNSLFSGITNLFKGSKWFNRGKSLF